MHQPSAQAGPPPDLSRLKIARDAPPRRARGRGLVWLAVLLVLGGAAWWKRDAILGAVRRDGGTEVATAVARRPGGANGGEVVANGYVIARRRAALSTVLSGRLVEVNVEEGDEVAENQVVARIQHDDFDAALVQAQRETAAATARKAEVAASLAASRMDLDRLASDNQALRDVVAEARSRSERAARDVERQRGLHEKRLIDDGAWDALTSAAAEAAAALAAAEARARAGEAAATAWGGEIARRGAALEAAEAEVARALQAETAAAILVEKTYVRAPFPGTVVHKDAEVGEVVAATGAGASARGSVATIIDAKTLEVQVELPETRLGRIAEGDPTAMHLDAAPEKAWPGRVRQVWPTADRQKATVEIRVEFVGRPEVLKPEMGVRVRFLAKDAPAAAEPQGVRVPKGAIARRDGKDVVFVVSNGVARRTDVVTGGAIGEDVRVASGLSGGETVVVDPPADLADGARVQPR
jgi:RND family efflux transporter MFP subunit